MAKPQRAFVMTVLAIYFAAAPIAWQIYFSRRGWGAVAGACAIIAGELWTVGRRLRRIGAPTAGVGRDVADRSPRQRCLSHLSGPRRDDPGVAGAVLAVLRWLLHRDVGHAWKAYRGWLVMVPLLFGPSSSAGGHDRLLHAAGLFGFKEYAARRASIAIG